MMKPYSGVNFNEEVLLERSYHSVPYDNKYLKQALNPGQFVSSKLRKKKLQSNLQQGRHNASYSVSVHPPCLPNSIAQKSCANLTPLGAIEHFPAKSFYEEEDEVDDDDDDNDDNKEDFYDRNNDDSKLSSCRRSQLDDFDTESPAHRFSGHSKPCLRRKSTLHNLQLKNLESIPTPADINEIKIVQPSFENNIFSEILTKDEDKDPTKKSKKWNSNENFLDRVRQLTIARGVETDPYGDNTASTFYRLPDGIRRNKKQLLKSELGSINSSAHNVKVIPYEPPAPPVLQDILPKKVGDKIYITDNSFQQERLVGVNQVSQSTDGTTNSQSKLSRIILANDNQYEKCLQPEMPQDPTHWFPRSKRSKQSEICSSFKPRIGIRYWTGLPALVQAGTPNGRIFEEDSGNRAVTESSDKLARSNEALVAIVNDWRLKWNLDMRYADATVKQLITDMADTHVHIRLKAITTCARAIEFPTKSDQGPLKMFKDASPNGENDSDNLQPEHLYSALECCLSDQCEQVTKSAAITLYTLERPNQKAESILREMLVDTRTQERWPAAQCLAYYGECDSEIVAELIHQLLDTSEILRHEQAIFLMSKLSENSTLVNSMLAELLNSSSWRNRITACATFPKMLSNINKDIVNKLLDIMWTDWHSEVRHAASQALGRCGKGKAVHDSLIEKLTAEFPERMKLEALKKIAHLGIMTAKLMLPFLDCFASIYSSIRLYTCVGAYNLMIKDVRVINELVRIAKEDITWKVKAVAIQALGKIGVVNPQIKETLMWAFRYEKKAAVRAEACHSIVSLSLKDNQILQCLQDRYLVESDNHVKEQIVKALEMCKVIPTSEMDMSSKIKEEVKRLCVKDNICRNIVNIEKDANDKKFQQKFIFSTPSLPTTPPLTPMPSADVDHHLHHDDTDLADQPNFADNEFQIESHDLDNIQDVSEESSLTYDEINKTLELHIESLNQNLNSISNENADEDNSTNEINEIFTANGISTPIMEVDEDDLEVKDEDDLEEDEEKLRSSKNSRVNSRQRFMARLRSSTKSEIDSEMSRNDKEKDEQQDLDPESTSTKVDNDAKQADNQRQPSSDDEDNVSPSPESQPTPPTPTPPPPPTIAIGILDVVDSLGDRRQRHPDTERSGASSSTVATSLSDCCSVREYILRGVGDAYSIVDDYCSRYAEFGIPSSADVARAWDHGQPNTGPEYCQSGR